MERERRFLFRSSRLRTAPQLLPWTHSWAHFTDNCTRCGECLRVCSEHIVVKGEAGFPTVDFSVGGCTFCYQCAASCPEKLFKSETQKPWAQLIHVSDLCLLRQGVECRSCGDSCEMQAIKFRFQRGGVSEFYLNASDCTGCGDCVAPCPVGAIVMETENNE